MITIEQLFMTYRTRGNPFAAVRGVSLIVQQGQFYTLLGPSGCGKTTTLRCVAGLEVPDSGRIHVGDVLVCAPRDGIFVAPNERNIGMVFQSYAIWPHMTVFDNVAFPLRHLNPRPNAAAVRERVLSALSLVKLSGLENRPAPFLSGGQQQRLALARALVFEPRVLLLDEPLSNLDAKLREEMRFELRDLVKRLDMTTLFVTHEQVEALTMSDVIAVMKDGEIVQEGPPSEIYANPQGPFVADFIGKTNIIPGKVMSIEIADGQRMARVKTAIAELRCRADETIGEGADVLLAARPENIVVAPAGVHGENCAEGEVETVVYLGNMAESVVKVATARLRLQHHPEDAPASGNRITVLFRPRHLLALRP